MRTSQKLIGIGTLSGVIALSVFLASRSCSDPSLGKQTTPLVHGASSVATEPRGPDSSEPNTENAAEPKELWLLHEDSISAAWETGSAPSNPRRPRHSLLDQHLRIPKYAREAIGLTDKEANSVQELVEALWKKMGQLASEYTEEDPLRLGKLGVDSAYRLAIPPNLGMEALADFEKKVRGALEVEKARKTLLSFNWSNYFGTFGNHEVLVQFKDHTGFAQPQLMAHYEERDLKTGRMTNGGQIHYRDFAKQYGDIFAVVDSDAPAAEGTDLIGNPDWRHQPASISTNEKVPVLGKEGILTYQAIAAFELSKREAVSLQSELGTLSEKLSGLAHGATKEIFPKNGDIHPHEGLPQDWPDENATHFRIAPFSTEAGEAVSRATERMTKLLGEKRTQALKADYLESGLFGNFGKLEIVVSFTEYEVPTRAPITRAVYTVIDPVTGKSQGGGNVTYEMFEQRFGKIFSKERFSGEKPAVGNK